MQGSYTPKSVIGSIMALMVAVLFGWGMWDAGRTDVARSNLVDKANKIFPVYQNQAMAVMTSLVHANPPKTNDLQVFLQDLDQHLKEVTDTPEEAKRLCLRTREATERLQEDHETIQNLQVDSQAIVKAQRQFAQDQQALAEVLASAQQYLQQNTSPH